MKNTIGYGGHVDSFKNRFDFAHDDIKKALAEAKAIKKKVYENGEEMLKEAEETFEVMKKKAEEAASILEN